MKKGILIGTIAIALIAAATIGISVFSDLKQEKILKQEVDKLLTLDVAKDVINMEIKSKGDYATIEKTIKEHLNSLFTNNQELNKLIESDQGFEILSIENYQMGIAHFDTLKASIETLKNKINQNYNNLILLSSEQETMKKIQDKKLDSYYTDLYRELVIGQNLLQVFTENISLFETGKTNSNKYLDMEIQVLDLLIEYQTDWYIEDGSIVIDHEYALKTYNDLTSQLNQIEFFTLS